ncbi:F-box protein At5g49610-like [Quercus lobata]|uniref:F-box domain-containing protein n=1 Tax=Quercus lobata TaxID=97700 RepID=A0A7N2M4Q7_QUELO|nr:F-box protein At5g49610-like [Quercus lobata]
MRYELKGKKNILQYCNEEEEKEEEEEENPFAILYENVIFDFEEIFTHYKMKEKNLLKYHKQKQNPLPNFPELVIYNIIMKIPAEYLQKYRCVCKLWHEIISSKKFIAQNFIHSITELLIVVKTYPHLKAISLRMDEKELDFKLEKLDFAGMRMGCIRSSCNGLVLIHDPKIEGKLNVINFLTKCMVKLPRCPTGCPHKKCGVALGFSPSTKEYKVVHMYADGFGYEIFTLGCSDNKWKCIPGPFKVPFERPFNLDTFRWSDPVSIHGQVLHWYVSSKEYIISMDVNDETPRKTYLPTLGEEIDKKRYSLLEMGGYLSVVYNVSDIQIDVWILKDFAAQVWFKKHSILAGSVNCTTLNIPSLPNKCKHSLPDFRKLVALSSLRNGEVIMFKHKTNTNYGCIYLYDIKHMELKRFALKIRGQSKVVPHRSSLICWKTKSELLPREYI